MSSKVRVGVIGTSGWAAWTHLPSFKSHPQAELVAICGRNRERAEEVAGKFDIPFVYTDYRDLIAHPGLDAVDICTPDDLHYPMTMQALDSNLHVLCEKPLALNSQQAREMLDKAKAKGVKHMMFFTYRWYPHFHHLKDLVDEGYIGRTYHVDFQFICPFALMLGASNEYVWRGDADRTNGIISDCGAHLIDMARWYVGEISQVNAHLNTFYERHKADGSIFKPANDVGSINLRFASGAQGHIFVSGVSMAYALKAALYGENGAIELNYYPWSPTPFRMMGKQIGDDPFTDIPIPEHYIEGLQTPGMTDIFIKRQVGPRLFVDAILNDQPIEPNFKHGWEVQRVIDAALASNRSGHWTDIF